MSEQWTKTSQIRCGNCGAVGQWCDILNDMHHEHDAHDRPLYKTTVVHLECAQCGVYTLARGDRLQNDVRIPFPVRRTSP